MKKTNFSEWMADRHPDFKLDEGFWSGTSSAEDRLASTVKDDRRAIRDNPAPRRISSDRNIEGVASDFVNGVKAAVGDRPDTVSIQRAAARAAGSLLSPRAANELFMSAALWPERRAAANAAKILLTMSKAGSALRRDDPTLKGTRMMSRAVVEKEITDGDRTRIAELLDRFLNSLVGPGSGSTATPTA